ncbi:MAG: hypothetical protein JNL72_15100 [Flavipsychrobacter sp.]|nr:hypothetical protein [Flavipsychrobacter sp.]
MQTKNEKISTLQPEFETHNLVQRAALRGIHDSINNLYLGLNKSEDKGDLHCTAMGVFPVSIADNPILADTYKRNEMLLLLATFLNIGWIHYDGGKKILIYAFLGHSETRSIFKNKWWRYRKYLQQVFKVKVENAIETRWQEYYPCPKEHCVFGVNTFIPIDDLFPMRPYIEENEADNFDDDMHWVEYDTTCALEYHGIYPAVAILLKYGINMIDSKEELIDRCYECASIGDEHGRDLFHMISSIDSTYKKDLWDEMFDNILEKHKGERDIRTLKWCIDNIYAPKIKEQFELEKISFKPEVHE